MVVYVEDGRVVIETREQLAQRIRREIAESWTRATADAVTAARLWDRGRAAGLFPGDRCCLALAERVGCAAVTAWAQLPLDDLALTVRPIR
jgi:PIN domain nuclease of toxin-antitoxin system